MPVRARRGIEALAILLVILLGVSVLLPLTAAAAAQVTGFISTCGGPATPVPGATVTLVDANGIAPPATATTDGGVVGHSERTDLRHGQPRHRTVGAVRARRGY